MWDKYEKEKDSSKDIELSSMSVNDIGSVPKPSKITDTYEVYKIEPPKNFDRKKFLRDNVENSPHKNHDEATEGALRGKYEKHKQENPGNFRKVFSVGIEFKHDKDGRPI